MTADLQRALLQALRNKAETDTGFKLPRGWGKGDWV